MNGRFVMLSGDRVEVIHIDWGLVHHRMKVATIGESLDFNRKFGWMDFMQISSEH